MHHIALLGLTIVTLQLALFGSAKAREPKAPTRRYNGSFIGLRVDSGLTTGLPGSAQDGPGFTTAAGMRLATILQIVDVGLGYRYGRAPLSPGTLVSHQVLFETRLHPFFLKTIEERYVLAGTYVLAGFGGSSSKMGGARSRLRPAYTVGLGIDFPLTPTDRDHGLWIGLAWAVNINHGRFRGKSRNLSNQSLMIAIELRHHALDFSSRDQ